MSSKNTVLIGAAVFCAALVGYVNMRTDELMVVIPGLMLCTFCLGVAAPRRAWRWGLLVGLAVPVSHVVGCAMGLTRPYPFHLSDLPVTCVALLPALAGAYLGAGVGWCIGRVGHEAAHPGGS